MYRIRKSWADAKSQIGAYKSLENAIKDCPKGYYVFDDNGVVVYPVATPVEPAKPVEPTLTPVVNEWYRIRKAWDKPNTQIGAYKNLDNAIKDCPNGYYVFDDNGKAVYPVEETKQA